MRLLTTDTIELEDFLGPPSRPYAILSHVWNKPEEVRYEDLLLGNQKNGYGYLKILKLCKIAKNGHPGLFDALEYAWIDTCCINTRETGEQSSAFYSMYKWYEDSKVCLVFLPDVKASCLPENMIGVRQQPGCAAFVEEDFLRSKWFTRGWTLQELLAPRTVLFYNSDFQFIGCKSRYTNIGLFDLFLRATGTQESVLSLGLRSTSTCIAQRMSWASYRETTEPEDVAYCLLGIFDIRMSLYYGEGAIEAFSRLQQKIIKKYLDESIFAWKLESEAEMTYGIRSNFLAATPKAFANCHNISIETNRKGRPSSLVKKPGGLEFEMRLPPSFRPRRKTQWFCIYPLACMLVSDGGERRSCCLKILVQDESASRQFDGIQPKKAQRTGLVLLDPMQERRAMWQALGWEEPKLLNLSALERSFYNYGESSDRPLQSPAQVNALQRFGTQILGLSHKPKRAKTIRLYFQHDSSLGIASPSSSSWNK